jgi:hypothetical protein
MDDEPAMPPWPVKATRSAKRLAAGIIYARMRDAGGDELASLSESALTQLAAAGAEGHAEACLVQSLVTVAADLLILAATAANQNPDQVMARLQATYAHAEEH